MEMSSQFCERESETKYKVDHEKIKEAKELTEKEAKTVPTKKDIALTIDAGPVVPTVD